MRNSGIEGLRSASKSSSSSSSCSSLVLENQLLYERSRWLKRTITSEKLFSWTPVPTAVYVSRSARPYQLLRMDIYPVCIGWLSCETSCAHARGFFAGFSGKNNRPKRSSNSSVRRSIVAPCVVDVNKRAHRASCFETCGFLCGRISSIPMRSRTKWT